MLSAKEEALEASFLVVFGRVVEGNGSRTKRLGFFKPLPLVTAIFAHYLYVWFGESLKGLKLCGSESGYA